MPRPGRSVRIQHGRVPQGTTAACREAAATDEATSTELKCCRRWPSWSVSPIAKSHASSSRRANVVGCRKPFVSRHRSVPSSITRPARPKNSSQKSKSHKLVIREVYGTQCLTAAAPSSMPCRPPSTYQTKGQAHSFRDCQPQTAWTSKPKARKATVEGSVTTADWRVWSGVRNCVDLLAVPFAGRASRGARNDP
jgi:hypothetical protein